MLPELRGKLFPYRGVMTLQKPRPSFPNMGSKYLWLFFKQPKYDVETGILDSRLYHMHQNASTGLMFCGSEKRRFDEVVTSDDTYIPAEAESDGPFTPQVFHEPWNDGSMDSGHRPTERQGIWSGIMGMTPDGFPLVGMLPQSITGRAPGEGEWIAAGFNGNGMPQCWSSGEAIARMALGEPTPDWLPEMYLPTDDRLADDRRMNLDAWIDRLCGQT